MSNDNSADSDKVVAMSACIWPRYGGRIGVHSGLPGTSTYHLAAECDAILRDAREDVVLIACDAPEDYAYRIVTVGEFRALARAPHWGEPREGG